MTTAAIMCIGRNESPFVEEWAHYHFDLGFDRLYYISTDDDPAQAEQFVRISRFRSRIVLRHFNDFRHGWQMRCYHAHRPLIEEDWLLVIDLDEFLYLHPFSSIQEYLQTVGDDVGQIQFPWLLLMSSAYSCERVLGILDESAGHVSDHVKSMVRLESASALGIHSHRVDSKTCLSSGAEVEAAPKHPSLITETEYFDNHPFVLHFASRGHLDVLNRIMDHQFFNTKSGHAERERLCRFLLEPADWSSLPTRCLLTHFYSFLPRVEPQISVPRIESATNVGDLRDIFRKLIKTVIDFEDSNAEDIENRFEERYRYARKLASLDPGGAIRLDEYLDCATQEGYINRLRTTLANS